MPRSTFSSTSRRLQVLLHAPATRPPLELNSTHPHWLIYLHHLAVLCLFLSCIYSCTLHLSDADRLWISTSGLSLRPTLYPHPSNCWWPLLDLHRLAVKRHAAASTHHEPRNAPLPPSSTQTLDIRLAINTNMHIWNILCYATESSN